LSIALALDAQALRAAPVPTVPAEIGGPSSAPLTWEDCVKLATQHNPDLQSARENVLNSDAVRLGAYSALYPQITADFTDNRAYLGPGLANPYNYSTNYLAELTLSQNIFNGFATKANIDQARAQLNLAFANLNAEKALLSYNLKSAFAQLLYAQELVVISQNVIVIRENSARLVRLLYDGGQEDKGAMLLSQANLDQAGYSLNQAIRNRDLSALQLAVQIGQQLPSPVQAAGELTTIALPVTPDFRKLAVQTPAYFEKQAQTDAAAAGITLAESGWYPTINATLTGYKETRAVPLRETGSFSSGWTAGFTASYPIFEGGRTYFDVKAADAAFRGALAELQSGTDLAALTLAQGFKNLVDTQENVRIQGELLTATALRYKIAEASYRNGLMSFQDFETITDSYVTQQQTTLSSRLNAVIAEADWEEVRGLGAIP
jgi:outer membrane protein TolC